MKRTKLTQDRAKYYKNWQEKNPEYFKEHYNQVKATRYNLDPEKRRHTYRLVKKYPNFVLVEHATLKYKECFTYAEYEELKVVD